MCIIVVKPKDQGFPAMKILKNCFRRNGDGAGYMFVSGEWVIIRKGFMSFTSLKHELNALKREITVKDHNLVFHFRMRTHGDILPGNTHPFPITRDLKFLTGTSVKCKIGICHNGIIPKITAGTKGISDTMEYVKMLSNKSPDTVVPAVQSSNGGKFVILSPTDCLLIGHFTEEKGIMYSNDSYKGYSFDYAGDGECITVYGGYGAQDSTVRVCSVCGYFAYTNYGNKDAPICAMCHHKKTPVIEYHRTGFSFRGRDY